MFFPFIILTLHNMYIYIYICVWGGEPGSSVGIATELRAGRSGVRILVGGEIFRTRPDRL